jgi:hypothetical protein
MVEGVPDPPDPHLALPAPLRALRPGMGGPDTEHRPA